MLEEIYQDKKLVGASNSPSINNARCELVSGEEVSFLEGKLKTLIESFGMSEKQEKSSKDMAQMVLWDWYNFICNHQTDHMMEKMDWYQKNNPKV